MHHWAWWRFCLCVTKKQLLMDRMWMRQRGHNPTTATSFIQYLDCRLMAVGGCSQPIPADHHHSGHRAATPVRLAVGGIGHDTRLEGCEERREHNGSKSFQLYGGVVHSACLYLHFTLVGGFDVEVKQEVGVRESSTIRPQLNAARRIRLRVNLTTSQVVVWDLWRTQTQTNAWRGWCVCVRSRM